MSVQNTNKHNQAAPDLPGPPGPGVERGRESSPRSGRSAKRSMKGGEIFRHFQLDGEKILLASPGASPHEFQPRTGAVIKLLI